MGKQEAVYRVKGKALVLASAYYSTSNLCQYTFRKYLVSREAQSRLSVPYVFVMHDDRSLMT